MSEQSLYTVSLQQLRKLFSISDTVGIGDDICVIDLKYDKCLDFLRHPCRFDGYLAFFCISGNIRLLVNLREFEIRKNFLFVNVPGNIISVLEVDESSKEDLHFVVIAMSASYMASLKLDVNKLFEEGMTLLHDPAFVLNDEEVSVAAGYLDLFRKVMHSSLAYKRGCVSSLLSSLFYLAGSILEKRIVRENTAVTAKKDRGTEVFDKFIKLVVAYHTSQRNIGFYADRMCLTPKYMAKIIKDTSGRTASDWIDSYVILEARNMLKYSGMTVKEIVVALNFPDTPSFYRFFKVRTGMTPVEYRKS